jgi:hypothetical protein
VEGCGQDFADGGLGEGVGGGGVDDEGVGTAELLDGLAAGSAGLAGDAVEGGNGDGADADGGAVEADGGGDGGLLGADGESVGCVFDVTAGDDVGGLFEQERCTDTKVAVGSVGVVGDFKSATLKLEDLSGREWMRCCFIRMTALCC